MQQAHLTPRKRKCHSGFPHRFGNPSIYAVDGGSGKYQLLIEGVVKTLPLLAAFTSIQTRLSFGPHKLDIECLFLNRLEVSSSQSV